MIRASLMFAIAAAVAACGARPKRATLLLDDVHGYHDGVRWEKFAQAAVRLPVPERADFIEERLELAEELRIADVELIRVHYRGKGEMAAEVSVRYLWHLDSRGIVHKTWAREEWERQGKRWILTRQVRTRGEPMPGLEEPEDDGELEAASVEAEAGSEREPNPGMPSP